MLLTCAAARETWKDRGAAGWIVLNGSLIVHAAPVAARRRSRTGTQRAVVTGALAATVLVVGAATLVHVAGSSQRPAVRMRVRSRQPAAGATVLAGSPAGTSAGLATRLLERAPAVVVAGAGSPADVAAAAAVARRYHAPLLLSAARGSPGGASELRAAIRSLHPAAVLAAGLSAARLATELPGVRVVSSASELPPTAAAAPVRRVTVLVPAATPPALASAVAATARVAGAQVISLTGDDPRTDPAAIRALAASKPVTVVGVGGGFGSASLLAARVAVAETGEQLPGGGQVLFPGREIVALYGSPFYPALGALGQQGLQASIARAKLLAAQYSALTTVPVVPAFEIIATVASASPGPGDTYSQVFSVAALKPWVAAATKAGLYVTLDLQPGRSSFLAEAKVYQSLLELPNVGLALDPEWQLQPGQLPLQQIGSVGIAEVNSVASWLASLTATYHLPQKLLELHEFRLSMIQDIQQLDTGYDDLAIVINMDGQGSPSAKLQTWRTVVAGAPKGVFFGWKDFYAEDRPMLGPAQTIDQEPTPVVISYQ
jgi:hypothetical protein